MPMTWATFAAAIDGARDASTALDALITSSIADIHETLGVIGAAEAGALLAQVHAADPTQRSTKLAASLEIIDRRLALDAPTVKRRGLFGRTHNSSPQAAHPGEVVWSAVLAGLIDSELGGDPEGQRSRMALALTALESNLAARQDQLTKSAYATEGTEGRRVLLGVFRLLRNGLKSRSDD